MKKFIFTLLSFISISIVIAQPDRWQQKISYKIDVTLNDQNHSFSGTENIDYYNNSPDTLYKLYFHLYWNAFQPNSSMDVRSLELGKLSPRSDRNGNPIPDWDARVKDRISKLQPNEIGIQKVNSIIIQGKEQKLIEHETILEVVLSNPILPKTKTNMLVNFNAQVPIQIRRSGRNNAEGVQYSMSQWYPKMVEYDYQGWNANQYIAREFYGVWGDYEVKINIDKKYMVAATGVLQNAQSIGYGYEDPSKKLINNSNKRNTWIFKGENIHDFVWAADTLYKHLSKKVRNGLTIHVFYKQKDAATDSAWQNVLWAAEKVLPFIEKKFGAYPYPQYSFIQGGDGGMEYAMATLLKGPGLGTVFHEWMHSWYQQILGTNESLFGWMDEGFTSFAENLVMDYYNEYHAQASPFTSITSKQKTQKEAESSSSDLPIHQSNEYTAYTRLANSGFEEPLTTHADHFNTNYGYSNAAYTKGAVFMNQLGYLVGDDVRDKILLAYYNTWKFKHPNANDFIRVAEKVSGLTLQWYKEYWVYSTKTIDYKIANISMNDEVNKPQITIERVGKMPMPLDILITYKDGSREMHYIPLDLMLGNKNAEDATSRIIHDEWRWTHPSYKFTIDKKIIDIKSIEIDPTFRMADMNRINNKIVVPD
jgi:hypothetical protein